VNLPAYVKSVVAAIIVFAGYLYATTRWPVPWFAPLIVLLLIGVGVVVAYLRTACTEIIIDTARITCKHLSKAVRCFA
jgi:F0F1-type ATP synthase assembly protein I